MNRLLRKQPRHPWGVLTPDGEVLTRTSYNTYIEHRRQARAIAKSMTENNTDGTYTPIKIVAQRA